LIIKLNFILKLYKLRINILNITYFFLVTVNVLLISNFNSVKADNLWIKLESGTSHNYQRIFFLDTLTGWVTGDSGIIYKTNNGGNSWFLQNSNTNNSVYDIRFINNQTGWAVTSNVHYIIPHSSVLRTIDGGNNWTVYPLEDTNLIFYTIVFQNVNTGWIAGAIGHILKSTNSGINWVYSEFDTTEFRYNTIFRMKFYNNDFGIACGGVMDLAGVLWKYSNSGLNWFSQGISPEPIHDVDFINSSIAVCVGGDFEFGFMAAKTTDAGITWIYQNIGYFGVGKAISFRTTTEAWVPLSYSNTFAVTTNSGDNWFTVSTPDSVTLEDIQFLDDKHGWTCGLGGAIYKYNSSLIGINSNTNLITTDFNLFQNYPNPFNPNTTIEYYLSKPSFVRLRIYDVSGREVKNIFDSYQIAGEHKIRFVSDGFASGVYFYSIETNFGTMTKKMMVLK
jgi:photosystem II stability/assembly factor-like uncharacterized protein